MPLDISTVSAGLKIQAAHVTQYYNLLTGAMTDQNVFFAGPKTYFNGLGCRVNNNPVATSVPNSATTLVTFNAERFDTDDMHSNVSNTSQLVCRTAGLYQISGYAFWDANATGIRRITMRVNGATIMGGQGVDSGDAALSTVQCPSTLWQFAVNDYVEMLTIQSSGGALNCTFEFMMIKVG